MTIVILENSSTSLRGQLSRWFLEVKAGVFVGRVNSRVRELLWQRITSQVGGKKRSSAVLIYAAKNEQGFTCLSVGDPTRQLADFDGLLLVRKPAKSTPAPKGAKSQDASQPSD